MHLHLRQAFYLFHLLFGRKNNSVPARRGKIIALLPLKKKKKKMTKKSINSNNRASHAGVNWCHVMDISSVFVPVGVRKCPSGHFSHTSGPLQAKDNRLCRCRAVQACPGTHNREDPEGGTSYASPGKGFTPRSISTKGQDTEPSCAYAEARACLHSLGRCLWAAGESAC